MGSRRPSEKQAPKHRGQLPQEPDWLIKLKKLAPKEWISLLDDPSAGGVLAEQLPETLPAAQVAVPDSDQRQVWELIGLYFRSRQRWYDAIAVYMSMYLHFLRNQSRDSHRINKGMPLVWISDCYANVGATTLAKRHLMLTLIEDAIMLEGSVDPRGTGSYFRLAWKYGLSDFEIKGYAKKAFDTWKKFPVEALFPEFVLQNFDKAWMVEIPSANESRTYASNTLYIENLIKKMPDRSGKALENLADYLMSCIPGCRTSRRVSSYSTEYDIVCSLEGPDVDFRSDFGRYIICECKDWEKPVGFPEFAKFARVLDSVKARFGVIFSREGISGESKATGADREQEKVFQDRNLVIAVVNLQDLEDIAKGGNFITLLRQKYEQVRLDLQASSKPI